MTAANNKRRIILDMLRDEPRTAKEIAEKLEVTVAYVRNLADDLYLSDLISKQYRNKEVEYLIKPSSTFVIPTVTSNKGTKGITINLSTLTTLNLKNSTSIKSIIKLPQFAARLLMAGNKFRNIVDNTTEEEMLEPSYKRKVRPLSNDLRLVKMEMIESYEALYNTVRIYRQILNNDQFWDLELLANHYVKYRDIDNQVKTIADHEKVLEIYTEYIRMKEG